MIPAYPLQWPTGRPRTPAHQRKRSAFNVKSFAIARDELLVELTRLRAKHIVLSTNLELRNDGLPYSNRKQPEDIGVAVYFTDRNGRQMAFCCDRWNKIEDNCRAIQKTLEALRGIDRWGSQDAVDQAFEGFAALPPAAAKPARRLWDEVLGVRHQAPWAAVEAAYRILRMQAHPDRGGTAEAFQEVEDAWTEFRQERGGL